MLIVTKKMQRNTIFFIVVKALHVAGGFPAHHQELKNCTCSIWYLLSLVAATASGSSNRLLGLRVRISPGPLMSVFCVGCPVKVSASGLSLV
jgi:hypothetical protein